MGDYRADIHLEFTMGKHHATTDMWINWANDGECDRRVIQWFEEHAAKGIRLLDEEIEAEYGDHRYANAAAEVRRAWDAMRPTLTPEKARLLLKELANGDENAADPDPEPVGGCD